MDEREPLLRKYKKPKVDKQFNKNPDAALNFEMEELMQHCRKITKS
jgi:hypothetical protein